MKQSRQAQVDDINKSDWVLKPRIVTILFVFFAFEVLPTLLWLVGIIYAIIHHSYK